MRFYGTVAYEDRYNGLALDPEEGKRICDKLSGCNVLFLANHGVIVVGPDVATAFDDLYYLERACMAQVLALSTGCPLKRIPEEVCVRTRAQFEAERQQSQLHLDAIQRVLGRESPEYLD